MWIETCWMLLRIRGKHACRSMTIFAQVGPKSIPNSAHPTFFNSCSAEPDPSAHAMQPSPAHPTGRPAVPSAPLLQHEKEPCGRHKWSNAPSNESIYTRGQHGVRCGSGPQVVGPCDSMAEVYAVLTDRLLNLAQQLPTDQK